MSQDTILFFAVVGIVGGISFALLVVCAGIEQAANSIKRWWRKK